MEYVTISCLVTCAIWMAYSLLFGIAHSVHAEMTRQYSPKGWRKGTVEEFWREFKSREWNRDVRWKLSFFDQNSSFQDEDKSSAIHAGIIRFDGVGMILGPVDYYLVTRKLNKIDAHRIYKGKEI